ncbi:MAG: formate dehydrogenase subunit alpha [bacterium]
METVTITLNGREISGRPGMTILELAREAGEHIPTLCYSPHLASVGACRVCIVEDEKRRALVASCVMPIAPGMVINTRSPLVIETRRAVVELLLSTHPESCMVCDKGNRCELRKVAADLGIGDVAFDRIRRFHRKEEANPFVERDLTKCIMCGKCVRACQEIQVVGAIDYAGRGFESFPSPPLGAPLDKSSCEFCGTCVTLCPVGALAERHKPHRGSGTRSVPTTCSFCGCGCSIFLEVKDNRVVGVRPNAADSVNGVSLCARGHYGYDFIHSPDRLKTPLVRKNGKPTEAAWDEALDFVAGKLKEIREKYGPESLGVFGSFRCTNEENYLLQKFTRAALGTNNLCNSARMSTQPTIMGLTRAFGYGCATNLLKDIEKSGVILLIGANPHDSHPIIAQKIKRAVKFNGAKLILVEPRRTKMTPFAARCLKPSPGADLALINGMMKVILDENLYDKKFVEDRVEGLDKLRECVNRYPPQYAAKITGIAEEDIADAARLFARGGNASIVYGTGLTQYINAAFSVIAVANLALLTGNVGKPGAGVFPLVKENNGQGACDMGVIADFLPGYRKVGDGDARALFEREWKVALPAAEGMTGIEMISRALHKDIRAIIVVGANPVAVFPDSNAMKRALESLDLLVVLDIFPTETAQLAHVVLPGACFAEKNGTFTNCERRIQRIRKAVDPPGESRPDWRIIADLTARMGLVADYSSTAEIMDEIARTTPIYAAVSYDRLEREPLYWPCAGTDEPGEHTLYQNAFPAGKGRFTKVEYLLPDEAPDAHYPFFLITRSSLYHFGSGARSRRSRRLIEMSPGCFIEISPADAKELQVTDGREVKVTSRRGSIVLPARITGDVPPGTLFVPVPHSASEVNSLFSAQLDVLTRIPNNKSCAVRVERT